MRVAFMGSPEFAVPTLRALATGGDHEVALVVSQPDKPAGRGAQLTAPAVKVAAQALGLPVLQPKSARTGELEQALKASGAELAIVVAYGKILPKPVLEALPRGCLNVHGSLLPKYRGAAPVQWAVIDGERTTGISIMQLDEGMDTGPVLLEREVAIGDDETSGELLARLAPIGAIALVDALARLDQLAPTPQDNAEASHARMLTKADGAIDFAHAPDLVAARIRGVDPWPGARATLRGETLKLFRAQMTDGTAGRLSGTVIAIDARGVHVSCKGGVIAIRELQAPGRKRMTAQQFAAGRGIEIGDKLDRPLDDTKP
ncbi:MAG TPA: methionyl-tRNA formyltransferase [Kofleriaceae bacterium]|jgi:methionyl-tRNA formyltransferase|nr:methionyl-tRNA formyltransferase [Kofleriaceae bacterium]